MAYGKDKEVLQAAGSFRQRAGAFNSNQNERRGSAGGGNAPFFVNQYKPSVDTTDTIRLIEGHYKVEEVFGEGENVGTREVDLPFFPWTEHFDGRTEKSTVCSAGPFAMDKKRRCLCYGCDIHWSTREVQADGKKKSDRMSKRGMYAWNVLDYGVYHKMPQIDRQTGQIRRNDQGEAYTQWTKCVGVGCDGCKTQAESVTGQARHWSMGFGHYQTLLSADEEVGKSCVTCGGFETITGRAWTCAGCGDAIVDMHTTNLKKEQIQEITEKREFSCNCGYKGFLNEIIECRGCQNAKRATVFDVDMQVKRVVTGKGDNAQTALQIVRTSAPRPIDKAFEHAAKPLPLNKIYAPSSLEVQSKQFNYTPEVKREPRTSADIASGQAPPPSAFVPQQAPGFGPPPVGFQAPAGFAPPGAFSPPVQPQQPSFTPMGGPVGFPPSPWPVPPKQ